MILPCKVCKIPEFRDTGTYGDHLKTYSCRDQGSWRGITKHRLVVQSSIGSATLDNPKLFYYNTPTHVVSDMTTGHSPCSV